MVVHQSMKRIHAVGAAGRVQEGQARRSTYHQAIVVNSHVCDVVRDKPFGSCENLLLASIRIETDQTICRSYRYSAGPAVRHDAIDTENMIIFHMRRVASISVKKIEATVEIANPNAPTSVCGQRRNIAIGENGRPWPQHLLPAQPARTHPIERIAGKHINVVFGCEKLA